MALRLKFGSHSQQPSLILHKSDIPEMLKDTKDIPMRHLILSVFNSRKLGRNPEHEWICIDEGFSFCLVTLFHPRLS